MSSSLRGREWREGTNGGGGRRDATRPRPERSSSGLRPARPALRSLPPPLPDRIIPGGRADRRRPGPGLGGGWEGAGLLYHHDNNSRSRPRDQRVSESERPGGAGPGQANRGGGRSLLWGAHTHVRRPWEGVKVWGGGLEDTKAPFPSLSPPTSEVGCDIFVLGERRKRDQAMMDAGDIFIGELFFMASPSLEMTRGCGILILEIQEIRRCLPHPL